MNGANIGTFDASLPADTASVGLADDVMRSIKTTFQQSLNDEHSFPAAGGSAVGYHLYGSARPYFGAQSAVSSSGTDGRIMVTSDTSRLFGVGSGGSVLLGAGPTAVSLGTFPGGVPQRAYWVEEIGAGMTNSLGYLQVTFPNSGFSGVPYFYPSLVTTGTSAGGTYGISSFALSASGVSVQVWQTDTLASVQSAHVMWRSLGSRTL